MLASAVRRSMERIDRFPSGRAAWWLGLASAVVLGGLFLWQYLDRGWIPHDDGSLAHNAERVLLGQLPHRDFTETYTGALSYANALAFQVFGHSLLAMRYLLFAVFILWVPALYYCATRLVSPLAGFAVTLLAIVWSLPNYPSSMPSWYNLFFATFGLAALLTYLDEPRPRWLILAGLAGGFSVLFKISGMFFVGAGVLGLVYVIAREPHGDESSPGDTLRFRVLAAVPVLLAALTLGAIGVTRGEPADFYHFALPGLAVTAVAGYAVLRSRSHSGFRTRRLLTVLGWYGVGVAAPILAFVLFYLGHGAVDDLVRGLFLLPRLRYADTGTLPLSPLASGATLFLAAVLVGGFYLPPRWTTLYHGVVIAGLGAALALAAEGFPRVSEGFFWNSISQATPLVVVTLALLSLPSRRGPEAAWSARAVFVAAAAGFCGLIQYPAAMPVYFCYVLPLTLLGVAALLERLPSRNRPALAAFAAVYLVFGMLFLEPFRLVGLAGPMDRQDIARLDLPKGGLITDRESAELYRESVRLLRTHAKSGKIFALDSPELYFLADLQNPTSMVFDYAGDSVFRRRLGRQLTELGVDAIAIRHQTPHSFPQSPPFSADLMAELARLYPSSREIEGRIARFTVRWRD